MDRRGDESGSNNVPAPPEAAPITFSPLGTLFSEPVLADEMLYVAGTYFDSERTGNVILYALDAESGQEQWRFMTRGGLSQPLVDGQRLYLATGDALYALDMVSGSILWQVHIGPGRVSGPALSEMVLFIGGGDGYVRALSAETGQELWRFKSDCFVNDEVC